MYQNKCFKWLIAGMVMVLMTTGCKDNKKEQPGAGSQKAMTVAGLIAQSRSLENKIISTGNVIANEEVDLRSEVDGRVVAINFEEGSHVTKGALLVKIDDRELQSQLKKMLVDEKQAKDDLYRKEKLLDLKAVSQEEYDKAFNTHGIVEAGIELIRTQISKTEIFAPFSGLIGFRQISPGGYISPTTLVARLQQTDPVKIDFAIPEKYRLKIRKGSEIKFRVEGNDSLFMGKIYAVEPRVDPLTRNVGLRAICPNPGGLLMPGSFARIDILLDNIPDAIVIPSEAIIPVMNGEKVYLCRNAKVVSQIIQTGIRTEREVEVLSGIAPGDTLITSGLLQLREDAAVKIRLPK